MNAIRHGLLAQEFLAGSPDLDPLIESCRRRFQPGNDFTEKLLADLADARSRLSSVRALETNMIAGLMEQQTHAGPVNRYAAAFSHLANEGQLDLLLRYEARFENACQRLLMALLEEVPT